MMCSQWSRVWGKGLVIAWLVSGLAACVDAAPGATAAGASAATASVFAAVAGKAAAGDNAVWIDVRTAEEYSGGHLPQAIHIPHEQIGSKIAGVTADKHRPIRLYCRSGRRSALALQTLQQLGYTNVQNMGAYEDLRRGGAAAM